MLLQFPRAAAAAAATASSSSSSARYLPARSPSDDPARLRVAVLTGWLGAGKTTTLTRWLEAAAEEKADADTASSSSGKNEKRRAPPRVRLIVNDVGASSVDAAVLSKAEIVPPASLVALTAGCACCSLQAELVDAVAAATTDARDFASSVSSSSALLLPDSWLFIECTGLALPSPVANAVAEGVRRANGKGNDDGDDDDDPLAEESLEAVVAVVDASTFAAGLAGAFDVDDDDDENFEGEEEEEEEEEDFEEEEEEEEDGGRPRFAPRDFAADEGPFEELAGIASPDGSVADLLASQVEAADVVLLNKTDAVSLETLEEARALVEALNPGAKVVESVKGDVPPSSLLGFAAAAVGESGEGSQRRRRRGVAGWAAALAAAAAARRGSNGGGKEEKEEGGAHPSHSHSHEKEEDGHGHHHHHGEENNKDGDLHPSAHGISSFVFHSARPFHPQRLLRALEDDGGAGDEKKSSGNNDKSNSAGGGPWKGVVRSKGFFWLATRPRVAGLWQAAGGSWVGDPSHLWERSESGIEGEGEEASSSSSSPSSPSSSSSSSPQQELVFIGNRSMSEGRVREALESALLTDEEMRGGEGSWSRFEDELPPWELEG